MSDIPLMPLSITDSSLRTSYWMSRICKGEDDSVWFDFAIIWSATLWLIVHIPSCALTDVSCSYEETHYGRDLMCRWWSAVSSILTNGCVKKSVKFSSCKKRQISGVNVQMMFISLKVRESFFNARQSRQPCHLDRPRARTSLIINIFPIITIIILIPTMCHRSHHHLHYFFALYLHFDWFNVVNSSMLKVDSDEPH